MSCKKFSRKKKYPKKNFPKKNFPKKFFPKKNSQKKFSNAGARRAPSFAAEGCSPPQELEKSRPQGGNFSSTSAKSIKLLIVTLKIYFYRKEKKKKTWKRTEKHLSKAEIEFIKDPSVQQSKTIIPIHKSFHFGDS